MESSIRAEDFQIPSFLADLKALLGGQLFVEAYVSCNDAYSCAIPRAIVEVVCKYFKCLRVVMA